MQVNPVVVVLVGVDAGVDVLTGLFGQLGNLSLQLLDALQLQVDLLLVFSQSSLSAKFSGFEELLVEVSQRHLEVIIIVALVVAIVKDLGILRYHFLREEL